MKHLQIQQAKQQFCAVADKAAQGTPQIVTRHGKPYVVIVGMDAWQKAQAKKKSVLAALRACPADLTELDFTRTDDGPRELAL